MATRLRSIPCPASSRSRDRRESASTSEPWQRAATISRNSRSSSEAIPGGPRRTVSQRSCGAMPAWPFCYCLIVKIWTLVERPLLAQSRPSAKRPRLQSGTSGERLGDGSKGITVPSVVLAQATVDPDAVRTFGPRGAQDELVLAAIAQNLRRLASLVAGHHHLRLCASRSVGVA
jgi:hypothetical protein